nr:helix-turn-helix transcriptional regulator [Modestobacter versicolor]
MLRRIRRAADCSQRELAKRLGISATAVAQTETGVRDLPASVLAKAAGLAGLRLGLVDGDGHEVTGMAPGAVRDRAGRHFPAHLDVRHGDVDWWHGEERYSRERPRYTFDRGRRLRDQWRDHSGTPPDHQLPQPGDALEDRAEARRDAAVARRRALGDELAAERRRLGVRSEDWAPTCSCPAGCDELLFSEAPLTPRQQAVPHLEDCPCRCDVS